MKFLSRLDDFEHIVIDGSVSGTGLSSLYLKDTATPILRIGNNTGDAFITYDGSELSISSDVDLRFTTPTDQDVFFITSSGNISTTTAGGIFTIGGGLTLPAITGGFLKTNASGVVSVDITSYSTFSGDYDDLTNKPTLGTASASAATDFVAVTGDTMTGALNITAVDGLSAAGMILNQGSSSRVMYIRGAGNIIQFQDAAANNKWELVGRQNEFYIYKNDGTGSGMRYRIDASGNHKLTGVVTLASGDLRLDGTGRIQGVDTVTDNTDAANKLYVDNAVGNYLPLAGGTLSGTLSITQTTSDFIDLTRDLATDQTWRQAISGAGSFSLYDVTRGADVFALDTSGDATFAGSVTTNGDIIIDNSSGDPFLKLKTSAQEYVLRIDQSDSEKFQIRNTTSSVTALSIDASSNATFAGSVNLLNNGGFLLNGGLALFPYLNDTYIRPYAASGDIKFQNYSGNILLTLSTAGPATFTGTVTSPTFLGDLSGTINTATTGATQTAGNNSTLIATTAYADAAAAAVPIGNYLPLTGGTVSGTAGTGAALVTIENTSGSTATSYGLLVKGGGNSSSGKTFEVQDSSGSSDFIIKGNGNVGIGTTDPDRQLELEAGTGAFLRLSSSVGNETAGNNIGKIEFYTNDTDGPRVGGFIQTLAAETFGRKNTMIFGVTSSNNATATEALRIDENANVGIGTADPSQKLHVVGVIKTSQTSAASENTLIYNQSAAKWGSSTHPGIIESAGNNSFLIGSSQNIPLHLVRSGAIALTIGSDNNVGIGNTGPGNTFTVGSNLTYASSFNHDSLIENLMVRGTASSPANLFLHKDDQTILDTNDLGSIKFSGHNGTDSVTAGRIWVEATEDWSGSTNSTRFSVSVADGTTSTTGLVIEPDGSLQLPQYTAGILTSDATGNVTVDTSTYLTSFTEADTLDSVTGRGATTTNGITVGAITATSSSNTLNLYNNANNDAFRVFRGSLQTLSLWTATNGTILALSSDTVAESITLDSRANQKSYINTGGNFGIGTDAPVRKLDVDSAAASDIARFGNNSGNFTFGQTTALTSLDLAASNAYRIRQGSTTPFYIKSDGFVGIGTTNPTIKFQAVQTTADWTGGFKNYATDAYGLRVDLSGSSGANAAFQVYTATGGGMLVKNNGKVGIGTIDPGSLLQVGDGGAAPNGTSTLTLTGANTAPQISTRPGLYHRHGIGLGVFSDHAISFQVNGATALSDAMRITNTGSVGIGTTSPGTQKLYVDGGETTFNRGNTDGAIATFRGKNNEKAVIGTLTSYFTSNVGIGTNNPGRKLTVQGADDGTMQLRLMGTASQTSYWDIGREAASTGQFRFIASRNGTVITPMVIDDQTGNVGIGSTAPAARLNVASTGANAYSSTITKGTNMKGIINVLSNNADDMVGVYFGTGTTGEGTHWSGITGSRSQNATDWSTQLNFYTHNETTSNLNNATQKMVIKGSGNVGIGTTDPGNKLTIASGTGGGSAPDSRTLLHIDKDGEAYISINSPAGSFNGIRLNIAGTPTAFVELYDNAAQGKKLNIGTVDARDLVFDTGNQPKMTILSGGNVGIGTTDPTLGLHVANGLGALFGPSGSGASTYISASDENTINGGYGLDTDTADLWVNYKGYQNGTSRFRDFRVGNGKTGVVAFFDGSSGNVGIGNTAPGSRLDLGLSSAGGMQFLYDSSQAYRHQILNYWNSSTDSRMDFNIGRTANVAPVTVMSVGYAGNVGIGTTSPSEKLTVDAQSADGVTTTIASFHSNEGESGDTAIQLAVRRSDSLGSDRKTFLNATGAGNFEIQRSGSTKMVIAGDGNVGIGTTNPTNLSANTNSLTVGSSRVDLTGGIMYQANGTIKAQSYWDVAGWLTYVNSGAARWYTGGSERMRITSGGNVGINTTNPDTKLQVADTGSTGLSVRSNTSGDAYMRLYLDTTIESDWFIDRSASTVNFRTVQSKPLVFATNNTEAIRIDTSQNVGIGTASPSTKLHVVGTAETRLRVGSSNASSNVVLELRDENTPTGQGTVITYNNSTGETYFNNALSTATTDFHFQSGEYGTASDFFTLSNSGGNSILHLKSGSGDSFITYEDATNELSISSDNDLRLTTPTDQNVFFISSGGNVDMTQAGGTVDMGGNLVVDGNVGIGTATPIEKFEISSGSASNLIGKISQTNTAYQAWWQAESQDGKYINVGVSNNADNYAYINTSKNTLRFLMNSSVKMAITSGGNVGIGTTDPNQLLHTVGGTVKIESDGGNAAGAILELKHANNNTTDVCATINFTNNAGGYAAIEGGTTGANNTGYLAFKTDNAGTQGEAVRILGNGNVGIGTDNPGYKLTVSSGTADIGILTASSDSGSYVGFLDNATSTIPKIGAVGNKLILDASQYVGIKRTDPSYALDVSGTIRATGDVIAYSDARVKENVETIPNALDKVKAMRGVGYNKIGEERRSIGVIAQEMLEVMPEAVHKDDSGMYSVAYGNLVGVLIEAMKEQQAQIDELKAQLNGSTK